MVPFFMRVPRSTTKHPINAILTTHLSRMGLAVLTRERRSRASRILRAPIVPRNEMSRKALPKRTEPRYLLWLACSIEVLHPHGPGARTVRPTTHVHWSGRTRLENRANRPLPRGKRPPKSPR